MLNCRLLALILLFSSSYAHEADPVDASEAVLACEGGYSTECKMRGDTTNDIYRTKVSIADYPGRPKTHILTSHYSFQLLQKGTDKSPGSDRPKNDPWTSNGLDRVLGVETSKIDNMDNLYTQRMQTQTMKAQCSVGGLIISSSDFFARGHYAANADYSIMDYKVSTFHYFNAAPQWQAFNNGKWKNLVEKSVQKLVSRTGGIYQIYTGSYGQIKCKDADNNEVPMYLKNEENKKEHQVAVPIPMIYFKVVAPDQYDRSSQSPIFIATINHPTMNKGSVEDYLSEHFCNSASDICDKLSENQVHSTYPQYVWFKESEFACNKLGDRFATVYGGYTYACEATKEILARLEIKLRVK